MVTSRIGEKSAHFTTYHRDHNILFQFILSDFLSVYREVRAIEQLAIRLQSLAESTSDSSKYRHLLNLLTEAATRLTGPNQGYMRLLSWNLDNGLLTNLKNNCALFYQNANALDKEPSLMHRHANQAWLFCLQSLDIMKAIQQEPVAEKPRDLIILHRAIEKLYRHTHRLARSIARQLVAFRQNENVVFFFLSNHKEFNALFGTKFSKKLLEKMYANGLEEALDFLLTRYSDRGFDNILPLIKKNIATLKAATP